MKTRFVLVVPVFALVSACADPPGTKTRIASTAGSVGAPASAAPVRIPSTPSSPEPGFLVEVPRAGDVFVDGAPVAVAVLGDRMAARTGDDLMVVRAEAGVNWGRVMDVLGSTKSQFRKGTALVLAVRDDGPRRSAPIRIPAGSPSDRQPSFSPLSPGSKASPGTSDDELKVVIAISVDPKGEVTVSGRPADNAFRNDLRRRVAEGAKVVVGGSSEAPFGAIVDAVKVAQAAGATPTLGLNLP